jgi:hypothetical protein
MKLMETPTSSEQNVNAQAEVIKLGLDIHEKKYVVARQIDEIHRNRRNASRPSSS